MTGRLDRLALLAYGLANALPATLFVLFVKHALGAEAHTGTLLLVYFGSGVLALPLWLGISRRLGKHRAWAPSMLWVSAVFCAVPVLGTGDVLAFGVICMLSGASVAADMALPAAIQADVVDYDTASGGGSRAGLFFGLWNLATKAALAAAVGLAFPLLDWAGFDPQAVTAQGVTALTLAYGALPIGFKLVATALVWRFPLTRSRQAELQQTAQPVAAG
jgi:Na+/melibiose symporter-like transporter